MKFKSIHLHFRGLNIILVPYPFKNLFNPKSSTMRTSLKLQSTPSTAGTIAKLALLGGFVFASVYILLMIFERVVSL